MVCNSCVTNIQENIGAKSGVLAIAVSLEKERALVEFQPDVTSAEAVREAIDDMGFDAAIVGELQCLKSLNSCT